MSLKLAYNTTETPLLVDGAGFQIGGRDWGPIDPSDSFAVAELAARRIVEVSEASLEAATDNPAAVRALAALAARRERAEAAEALSKDELLERVGDSADALPVGGDGKPAKADLVEAAVADPEVDVTTSTTTTKPRRGQK